MEREGKGQLMIGIDEDKPCVVELHATASNASSLQIDIDRRSRADIVGAAGMVRNQLGLALLHLRAEWDRCDKPRKKTAHEIAQRSMELKDKKGKPDLRRARVEALTWHAAAMRERASRLAGRSVVIGLLTDWATEHEVEIDLLSPALFHWLSPACPVCSGHGKIKAVDAPTLTDKACDYCKGAGTWPRPFGAERVHQYMKRCIGGARKGLKEKLYG
jgi:hypothetical protein